MGVLIPWGGLGDEQWRSEMDGGTSAVCWSLECMDRRWEDIVVVRFECGGDGGQERVCLGSMTTKQEYLDRS